MSILKRFLLLVGLIALFILGGLQFVFYTLRWVITNKPLPNAPYLVFDYIDKHFADGDKYKKL